MSPSPITFWLWNWSPFIACRLSSAVCIIGLVCPLALHGTEMQITYVNHAVQAKGRTSADLKQHSAALCITGPWKALGLFKEKLGLPWPRFLANERWGGDRRRRTRLMFLDPDLGHGRSGSCGGGSCSLQPHYCEAAALSSHSSLLPDFLLNTWIARSPLSSDRDWVTRTIKKGSQRESLNEDRPLAVKSQASVLMRCKWP